MEHFTTLIALKLTILRNSFLRLRKKSKAEFYTLIAFFAAAAAGLYFFFLWSFSFFNSQDPFGPILIEETFYLFTFAIFIMLLISSAVSSHTSLFRSGEISFLLTHPPRWQEIYFIKLAEALWYSSWALLFLVLPFMLAYGVIQGAPLSFIFVSFLFYIPFIILTGTLGTLASTLITWILPDRRRRRIALILTLITLAALFIKIQPQMIKEQGSIAGILTGYLPHVTLAKNPLLPSTWMTRGILSLGKVGTAVPEAFSTGLFYFLLLLSNTLFFLIPSASVAARLYPGIYLLTRDHHDSRAVRRARWPRPLGVIFDLPPRSLKPFSAFLEKDLKTFLRDPAEWSQMLIFFGLLLLYFVNLRNLQFHVLQEFWKNLIFVLNTVGIYIVLSSFSMRLIFPMISLEGKRFWIIDLSPIRFTDLLLEKFLLGTFFSVLITIPLVFLSGWMLEIPLPRILFTIGLGFLVCVALTGLSVGFGAKFPNFKSNNPSEILSGLGGSLLLSCHLGYLALIGLFLALSTEPHWLILLTVAAGSLLTAMLPIKAGHSALKKMEF